MRLYPGDIFQGTYEIECELGKGGMGSVYLATHRYLRRKVALKIPATDLPNVDKQEVRARMEREACLMARLHHDHIVTVYDMNWAQEPGFISLEYIEGPSLEEWLRSPPPAAKLSDVMALAHQIAKALDYIHQEKIVHRDLKPQNILVEIKTDKAKLLDFGIARSTAQNENLFQTLMGVSGTPGYMSPEQVVSDDVNPAMDVYSFGILLFTMLTKALPWKGQGVELLRDQMQGRLIPPCDLNPVLPPMLEPVFAACFGDSAKRPQTAQQTFLAILRGLGAATLGLRYSEVLASAKGDLFSKGRPMPTVREEQAPASGLSVHETPVYESPPSGAWSNEAATPAPPAGDTAPIAPFSSDSFGPAPAIPAPARPVPSPVRAAPPSAPRVEDPREISAPMILPRNGTPPQAPRIGGRDINATIGMAPPGAEVTQDFNAYFQMVNDAEASEVFSDFNEKDVEDAIDDLFGDD